MADRAVIVGSGAGASVVALELAEAGWDVVMLVRHRSPETFLSFASNEAYLGGMGHRLAAFQAAGKLGATDGR